MDRREYATLLTTLGTATIAGCSTVEDMLGGDDGDSELQQIKANARSPGWNTLMENINDWRGEPVHYAAVTITATTEMNNGSFQMTIEHPDYRPDGDRLLRCDWFGDSIDAGTDVDIWGTVEGTHTFSVGEERTVPSIHLEDMYPSV
ncbi:hypothetical protein [Halovenus salina]|uniref:Uncharacterized protein n=1 Tax=Halovenus salina TaxID=1510225 RepID=A0ABD5W7F0_9EURY|nr:hypothetical protein [Halovenus salina]